MIRIILCRFLLLSVVALLGTMQVSAQMAPEAVKAASLFNVGKFVRWDSDVDFSNGHTICIPQDSPLMPILRSQSKRKIFKRSLKLASFTPSELDSFLAENSCHILYVPQCMEDCQKALDKHRSKSMVTVSDTENAALLTFISKNDRIRMSLNTEESKVSQIDFSPQFLILVKGRYARPE